jgi:outer membrane receptor protein involved in Fe transport
MNYHVLPQHTLRAAVSSATRNPVMAELYLTTAKDAYWRDAYVPPAEDLRPEKIRSRELGYIGQFGSYSVDGRIYHEKVRDIIMVDGYADISDPSDPKFSFKNLFEATFRGLDLSANYRWEDGRVTVNYSRQSADCAFSSYPTQYFHPVVGPLSPQFMIGIT